MFRTRGVLVLAALIGLLSTGCSNRVRQVHQSPGETQKAAPAKKRERLRSHKKGGVFAQATPARELRLSDETYRPVKMNSVLTVQSERVQDLELAPEVDASMIECVDGVCYPPEIGERQLPPPVRRGWWQKSALQTYKIPGAWQELVRGFLITTPERVGDQWRHATYLRAVRDSSGNLIGVDLFESPSHRLPFATVGSGASEHFALIELAVGEAQSATVRWEGDQPVTINLYR